MYPRQATYNLNADYISVEANGDNFYTDLGPSSPTIDEFLRLLPNYDFSASEVNVSGVCDLENLIGSITQCDEFDTSEKYVGLSDIPSITFNNSDSLLDTDYLPNYTIIEKKTEAKRNKKPISLSTSVDVREPFTLSESLRQIEIVKDLEEKYRPRYKSDYFTQSGKIRRPRYVADREGNHFITLKVPPCTCGKIRVDWLTLPNENDDRYYMPYKFQVNNESADTSDGNPIFIDFNADSTGIIKLYLVLIKAKQDALKSLQPLQQFQPREATLKNGAKNTTEKVSKLTPKQLIQQFKLTKSQLAFTLCPMGHDDASTTELNTTVYSTILEEIADNVLVKTIRCPNCSHTININDSTVSDKEEHNHQRKKRKTTN